VTQPDLASAFQLASGVPATMRVGTVTAINPLKVSLAGAAITNVGILSPYVPNVGDTVALIGQPPQDGPDPATWLAIGRIVRDVSAPQVQAFTTAGSYTWTKPQYSAYHQHRIVGGGGGGGSVSSAGAGVSSSAGGGGGGGYGERWWSSYDLPDQVTGTVGAGGAGAAAGGSTGSSGSTTDFNGSTATGGGGGQSFVAGSSTQVNNGGGGGSGSGNNLTIQGDDGLPGSRNAGFYMALGMGGASHLSGLQDIQGSDGGNVGIDGKTWGGGGSGAYIRENNGSSYAGGDGARGVVLVTTFFS